MKKMLCVPLLFFSLSALASPDNRWNHYRIWLNPASWNEQTNKQNLILQIRNISSQPQYQVKVYLNIYKDKQPDTWLMDDNLCMVGRSLKEDDVWNYYMPEWGGTAAFLIPMIDTKETFEFLLEWSEPVSIQYSSVSVYDEDDGFAVDIWPDKNKNDSNRPKTPPIKQLSLINLYPDAPRRCSLSL